MNSLFSKASMMILESLSFTKALYAFDFDGTLSKIVRVPSDASMSKTTAHLLHELSHLVPVAIISGRSMEDLRRRLPFEPPYLIGNHGLEGLPNREEPLKHAENDCHAWKETLSKVKWESGVELEDKRYSLAVHFRRSRNKKNAKAQIHAAIEQLMPIPRVIIGKSVFNLLPIGAPHKGVALMELMRKTSTRHAFYIGDDDTDEDVFGLPDDQIMMTVRVGEKRSSHARYYIDRQSEINRVLELLIRFHQPSKNGKRNGVDS